MTQRFAIVASMHLTLHHHRQFSILAAEGELGEGNVDGVVDMLSRVPLDQALIVDLLAVTSIDGSAAAALRSEFRDRVVQASVTVAVADLDVTMQLVLRDVDRCSQFVRTRSDAIALTTGVLAGR